MALHEMRLILAKILWHFDFELAPESVGWAEKQRVFALWEKRDLIVRLRVRG
jgi:aspirochlorine biosynthesis cytochrome P450 monooxygenase